MRAEEPHRLHVKPNTQQRAYHAFPGFARADTGGKLMPAIFPPGEISCGIRHPHQAHHKQQDPRAGGTQIQHCKAGRNQHRPTGQRHQQRLFDFPACHQPDWHDNQPQQGRYRIDCQMDVSLQRLAGSSIGP